jgi:hypothetical protein
MISNHELGCGCWRCTASQLGDWFDQLGAQTEAGEWQHFVTVTYRTKAYPWSRGFPGSGDGMPNAEFGHHCFENFVSELSARVGARVDYIVGDQYGELHGRFHQHALLAANGLDALPCKQLEGWLRKRGGWSRVLPFERGAAYYLAKYIGLNLDAAEWTVQVGRQAIGREKDEVGRIVIAKSADLSSALFHQTLPHRKR